MKDLRTSCDGCMFKVTQGCYLEKPVYIDGNNQFTKGFCGTKRPKDWLPKNNNLSLNDNLECEEKLSVSILCLNNDIDGLKTTLDCVNSSILDRIVVILQNPTIEQETNILEWMSSKTKTSWTVDKILDNDSLDLLMIADYSTRLIKSSWVLIIKAGDIVDKQDVVSADVLLSDIKRNYVCFYFDENDPLKVFFNRVAFEQLEGNYQLPFFEKVKTFDNWREFCLKIN